MSTQKNKLKLEEKIMSQVKSGRIVMKPKWYFVLGSLLLFGGVMALSLGAMFLVNLTIFSFRGRGPMAHWKLQLMLENFPWWVPALAITGIVLGVQLLKKYDFSYKKDFKLIIILFVLSILAAGFLIDQSGLNDHWSRRGHMRQIYQQLEPGAQFARPRHRFN